MPHYPLRGTEIFQAFTMGRVRVLLTDTRTARDPGTRDGSEVTMLGAHQLSWLLAELEDAARTHELVIWVNPTPWIASSGGDTWAGYAEERREISDFVAARGIDNLLMLSGDAHMVAIDDGTNNTFSSDGSPAFPVFHAAPLDRPGSVKGGPYTHGPVENAGQFGLVEVRDDGGSVITVTLRALDYTGTELLRHVFEIRTD